MLINYPNRVICKVGNYSIIVLSDKTLEESPEFDTFCDQFKLTLMSMVALANKESTVPAVAHEGVS